MTNKFDLNTQVWRNVTASAVTNVGGAIAADKTRFLTYIRVDRLTKIVADPVTSMEIAVGSQATGAATWGHHSIMTSGHFKLLLHVASVETAGGSSIDADALLSDEVVGSIDQPILSVAGSNYMTLSNASDVSIAVFAQYYDE